MIFNGFQKLTLLDFPTKTACTLFTAGCNFRCPFCHNASLVSGEPAERIPEEDILAYLKKRKGLLDGVCVTGGEPLLHTELADFLRRVKELGMLVKLDTNGSFPERLARLCREGLVDYVAMDVKNSPGKYALTAGLSSFELSPVLESIGFLNTGGVVHEFRTTVSKELHTPGDIREICVMIKGAGKYYIQNFVDSGDVICQGMRGFSPSELSELLNAAREIMPSTELRGG